MVMANAERVSKALDLLADGLRPKCEQTWQGVYGDDWLDALRNQMHGGARDGGTTSDIAFVLSGMKATWNEIFGHGFSPSIRSLVFEVADTRNNWAHKQQFSTDDTARALDSMERLLDAFGDTEQRQQIRDLRHDLMRQMFDEEARTERRRTAAKPTEGQPQAGLTPWREVITPHSDVQTGRFDQAEFAADLYEVSQGTADHEYQDPEAFFALGCIDVTDRKKDMFINGGFNVYPAEVEKVMAEHHQIGQVAVIGVPDERRGEVGAAFVVSSPAGAPDGGCLPIAGVGRR